MAAAKRKINRELLDPSEALCAAIVDAHVQHGVSVADIIEAFLAAMTAIDPDANVRVRIT